MAYTLGVVLFAVAILLSVCLHEAGHMGTAKAFGMKVTRYFVGFGPTLFSFRRGETEYGLKAIPAGGFVKIVGMTPLEDDDIAPGEEHRAFWRHALWKRTVVLAAGSATHFVLGFVLLWVAASFVGVPNPAAAAPQPPVIGEVTDCITDDDEVGPDGAPRACEASDPVSPASAAGLRVGDRITSVNGIAVADYTELVRVVREQDPDDARITYERDGASTTVTLDLVTARRASLEDPSELVAVPTLGIAGQRFTGPVTVTYGPIEGTVVAADYVGELFVRTATAITRIPEKIPPLWNALFGAERDPETPISVVGASRLGGELVASQRPEAPTIFLLILASLNVFVGIFNLFPLLPLDGGHIAIAWFERVRSWWAARRGRPDPGRVDYTKLMPITYAVILVMGTFSLLTIATDIVNPITIFP